MTEERTTATSLGETSQEGLSKNQIAYSHKEEWLNRITHLVGAALSLVAALHFVSVYFYLIP